MLQTILKSNQLISDYVSKVKSLGVELNAIGESVSNRDMIMYVLNGLLGSDFNPCICSLKNGGDEISMEKVHSQLLTYENLLEKKKKSLRKLSSLEISC